MPKPCSQCASSLLNAASPMMPFSTPIEVMPTCTVDRNRVGCSISRSAAAAPASPDSAMVASRALRLEANAISDMAKTPFSTVNSAISRTSMNQRRESDTMALYLIGDVQGCDAALQRLLEKIDFSPSRDTLYLLGDLVNRGPQSDSVLRRVMRYGEAARSLLGNHDLSLLALAHGQRPPHRNDTMDEVLTAPDFAAMIDWLRRQRMAIHAHGLLMVHGGVLPQWDLAQTLALASEVEDALRGPGLVAFLAQMYGNEPARWTDDLVGAERLRVIVNALTRLRFCTP